MRDVDDPDRDCGFENPARRTLHAGTRPACWRLGGPIAAGASAVEIGRGSGHGTKVVLDYFDAAHVDVVDLGPPMIGKAERRLPATPTGCDRPSGTPPTSRASSVQAGRRFKSCNQTLPRYEGDASGRRRPDRANLAGAGVDGQHSHAGLFLLGALWTTGVTPLGIGKGPVVCHDRDMRSLPIRWQRLVDSEGRTCVRCAATQHEVEQAVAKLEQVLAPLNLSPELEVAEIDAATFQQSPGESNRIWIAGRPMEDWLDATVGSSRCCSVCGDSDCRTVEVRGTTFEAIPERLILQAALVAASEQLGERADSSA